MSDSPSGSIVSDTPTAAEDQEVTLEAMQVKLERLKSLLLKARTSINQYKARTDEQEKEIESLHFKNTELKGYINKLTKYEPPQPAEISKVLTRVKVYDQIFNCVQSEKGIFWVSEKGLPSKKNLPEVLEITCTPSVLKQEIAKVVDQYEDRMRRMKETADAYELKNESLQTLYKELQEQLSEAQEKQKLAQDTKNLVSESSQVYEQIMNIVFEEELDSQKVSEIHNCIRTFVETQKGEVAREHLGNIYKSMADITRRLMHSRNEIATQEKAWRATCDALVHEKEELKSQMTRLKNDLAKKTEEYAGNLHRLKEDNQKHLQEAQREVDFYKSELKKQVNLAYLKHVLLQYFCSTETAVQERLISVITTLLNFSSDEIAKVKESRAPKGVLTRFLNWP